MPKNNSYRRKQERKEKVVLREKTQTYRECSHWHTDKGYMKCQARRTICG